MAEQLPENNRLVEAASDAVHPSRADALYSVAQIRAIEAAAQASLPADTLMQRAGAAAGAFAAMLLRQSTGTDVLSGVPVLIVAGPGNNGGDAFGCAAALAHAGCAVTVLCAALPLVGADAATATDAAGVAEVAGVDSERTRALRRARTAAKALAPGSDDPVLQPAGSLRFADFADIEGLCKRPWALVVDGLFGIGLTRALNGFWASVVTVINRIDAPVLALDVPSGLNADTGTVASISTAAGTPAESIAICIAATHTLTFIGDKPGLHTGHGRDLAGRVATATLDIPEILLPAPHAWLSRPGAFDAPRYRRRQNSHKGTFGDVQVIGGAAGMTGAAILAATAALKTGAGRVLIGFVDAAHAASTIACHPELMCRLADDLDFAGAAVVIGPGLGSSVAAQALLARACSSAGTLVVDADALNMVAADPSLQAQLAARASGGGMPTLLTPHPLEAARLLGITAAAVQADRLQAARLLARRFGATVVLKGSGTVVAHAGSLSINPTGNPALASGGTGDVLAGMCGALLAQSWPVHQAALAAVWMHGAAADALVAAGVGPVGVTASEIIDAARTVLNGLIDAGSGKA